MHRSIEPAGPTPFLSLRLQVHLYGLYLDLYLWDQPHYRAKTYRHDLLAVRDASRGVVCEMK
jgi:hypothetical protein